jgi:hypothetical protein
VELKPRDPAGNLLAPSDYKPRTWKVASEMTYDDYFRATNQQLGGYRKRREIW